MNTKERGRSRMSEPSSTAETLVMYVIYWNPSDYPGQYVVRKWTSTVLGPFPSHSKLYVGTDLQEARAVIPRHCDLLPKELNGPDPVILETWM